MKKALNAVLIAAATLAAACSTTTTTTYYKDDGTIDHVVVESEISDANALANYLQQADQGCATDRSLDVTRFTLGYADIGLSWLSIGGNSTRAPATPAAANNILEGMAKVKTAGKTTIQTEKLAVNTEVAKPKPAEAEQKAEQKAE